jgi:hypothetical protein
MARVAARKHQAQRVMRATLNRGSAGPTSVTADVPARWWTAGPAVGTERPTALSCIGQSGPALSNGAALTGREMNMWRNEGWQFGSALNLTDQH